MFGKSTKGMQNIIAIQLRQHRFKIIIWFIGIVATTIAVALAYEGLFSNPQDLQGLAITMQNPAMVALLGPVPPVEDFTIGVALASEMLLFTIIAVAIMNILLICSMTREDEDEGRLELIQALPVGRLAYSLASVLIVFVLNFLIFIVVGFSLNVISPDVYGLIGSLLYGAAIAVGGLFFAAVSLLAAQLFDSGRSARVLSFIVLIVLYIIRAIGDVLYEPLSLISPLGLAMRTNIFVDNNIWPVIILFLLSIGLMLIALVLNKRRDLYQGLLPQRSGRSEASSFLKNPFGLIWNQEKVALISWALGITIMGAAFGAIFSELDTYFAEMELLQLILDTDGTASITRAFVELLFGIMSIFVAIPGITLIFSVLNHEKTGRIENIYSRKISRTNLLLNYTIVAVLFVVILQILLASSIFLPAEYVMDNPLSLGEYIELALLYLPSLFFMIGLTIFFLGLLPKFISFVWVYLSFGFIVIYLSDILEFPEWLNNLSIFHHAPTEIDWPVLLTISGSALLLTVLGFIGYNRRDIKA